MPTQIQSLAKNRNTIIQNKFIDGMLGDISPDPVCGEVMFYGKTTGNTPTELFINGKGGAISESTTYFNRLCLPESTLLYFEYVILTYNATDDTFPQMEKGFGVIQNLNGTTAAPFDINKAAGVEVTIPLDIVANGGASGIDLAQGSGAAVAFSADNTNDALVVTATGTAAKTIYYKVFVRCYSINEAECLYGFFFGDTAAQNRGI